MGCITRNPANEFNFISAHDANDMVIADLANEVTFCARIVGAPILNFVINSATSITFNWINVGATDYRLEISEDAAFTSPTVVTVDALTHTETFANNFITRFARVRGNLAGGTNGAFSNVVQPILINAPTNLATSDVQLESIRLDWTDNNDGQDDGVTLQRSIQEDSGFSTIANLATGVTFYVDDTPPLNHNTTYYYRVFATYTIGSLSSAFSNTVNATTLALAAPTGLGVSSTIYNSIVLTWISNSAGEEDAFSIERSLTSGSGFEIIATVGTGIVTFTDTTGSSNTTYYYRVRATELQGNSAYSNEVNVTTGSALFTLIQPNLDRISQPNGDILITND